MEIQVTSHLFEYTWHHWHEDTQSLLKEFSSLLPNPESSLLPVESRKLLELRCERWLLCLKALRRMLKFGFPSDAKSVQVKIFNVSTVYLKSYDLIFYLGTTKYCLSLQFAR